MRTFLVTTLLLFICSTYANQPKQCAIKMRALSSKQAVCEKEAGRQCRNLCTGQVISTEEACGKTPFCCFVGGKCTLKFVPGQQKPVDSDTVSNLLVEKFNKTVKAKLTSNKINGKNILTVGKLTPSTAGRFLPIGGTDPFGGADYDDFNLEEFLAGEGLEGLEGIDFNAGAGGDAGFGGDYGGFFEQEDAECAQSFPDNCVIEFAGPENLNPKINIPYCQRIACDPTNSALDLNMEECLLVPGCAFDDDLFLYRTFAGDSFLPGVPVCHLAIRNKAFQKHAIAYMQEHLEWSPLLSECMIEEYKDEILGESAGCHMLDVLEHFGKSPKLAGWKGIRQRDCYLINGCWRNDQCVYPMEPGKDIKVKSTNDVKHAVPTPADRFGQPACQAFDPDAIHGNFLDSFHQCLAAGCATDVSRETLMKHFHGVTSTYLPQPMQYQYWSQVMLGLVRPDNWKQVADDLKKMEKATPMSLLNTAQLHYVGSFKTPKSPSSDAKTAEVAGRMLGMNGAANELLGGFSVDENSPFGGGFASLGAVDYFGGELGGEDVFGFGVGGDTVDPIGGFLNMLPENGLAKADTVNVMGGGEADLFPELTDYGSLGGAGGDYFGTDYGFGGDLGTDFESLFGGGNTELPDHLSQGAVVGAAGVGEAEKPELASFGAVNPLTQNKVPGAPFGNNVLLGAGALKEGGHNSKHPVYNNPFLKVNLGNAGLLQLGATGQIRPAGGVGSINQYLPNVLYNVEPQDLCPFNVVQWEGMPPLKGSFEGCCEQPLCYQPRESLVFARSGVASYLGAWTSWTQCTKTCGTGTQKRVRNCVGDACDSSEEETQECNFQACPAWGEWSAFDACSRSCGGGSKVRSRVCDTVSGGCAGSATEQVACNTGACPLISAWGEWSKCSVDCGRGQKIRRRTCTPSREHECPSGADEIQSQECRVYCGKITMQDTVCDVTTCVQYPRCVRSDGQPGFCREELIRANAKPCYAGRCLCRVFPSATGCF